MLELSTKYAIKALLHLSNQEDGMYVQVQTLSKLADIPGSYLSKLVKILARKGIVDSKRGSQGGIRFSGKKKRISFLDICIALEDPILSQGCFLSKRPCNSKSPCVMHKDWSEIREQLKTFLDQKEILKNY